MKLYDKKDVAQMFKCSVSKIEKMMRAGEITYINVGSLVRFRPSDLMPFFEVSPLSPTALYSQIDQKQVIENTILSELLRDGKR